MHVSCRDRGLQLPFLVQIKTRVSLVDGSNVNEYLGKPVASKAPSSLSIRIKIKRKPIIYMKNVNFLVTITENHILSESSYYAQSCRQ